MERLGMFHHDKGGRYRSASDTPTPLKLQLIILLVGRTKPLAKERKGFWCVTNRKELIRLKLDRLSS